MASGRMVLGDAKSGRDFDPTLRPDSRLAFRRPGRQTYGAHRTQGIIFADGAPVITWVKPEVTRSRGAIFRIGAAMGTEDQIHRLTWRIQGQPYADMPAISDLDHFSRRQRVLRIIS